MNLIAHGLVLEPHAGTCLGQLCLTYRGYFCVMSTSRVLPFPSLEIGRIFVGALRKRHCIRADLVFSLSVWKVTVGIQPS